MIPETFRCLQVRKTAKDQIERVIDHCPMYQLPAGDVLIRVLYSSLNYKDAMAASGHPGVVRKFPHVPGIDAMGVVVEDNTSTYSEGDNVLVTGYELGAERWGGWSEYIRVPADWVVPLPDSLSPEDAMVYGTAGLTAGLCVRSLKHHGVQPDDGDIVVTGATGGVGAVAIAILAKLGYQAVAVTGKAEKHAWLKVLGASRVIGRDEVSDTSRKPLLSARWAGAVDTVGGNVLANLLRSTKRGGCVTACGLVGGAELPTTVHPFILRGVTLSGIDSAWCPRERRMEVWQHLANDWLPSCLREVENETTLDQIEEPIQAILAGRMTGRTVVRIHGP